jgi:hypothetical protein
MRLTIGQLRRIIRETVEEVVEEQEMAELEELEEGEPKSWLDFAGGGGFLGGGGGKSSKDSDEDSYSSRKEPEGNPYGYGDSRGGGSYSTDSKGNYHGRSSGGGNQRGAAWD